MFFPLLPYNHLTSFMNKDNLLSRVIALQLQSARFEIVPTKFPIHPIVGTNSICAIYEEILEF